MKTMEAQERQMPLRYNKDPKPQKGEIFYTIEMKDKSYQVSNYGRVKRMHHIRANERGKVLTPHRGNESNKFNVRLYDKGTKVIAYLVYLAIKGEPPLGMEVVCKDGDRRNLHIDNLHLLPRGRSKMYKPTRAKEDLTPLIPAWQQQKLPKTIEVNLNTTPKEDHKATVKEMNKLRGMGYVLRPQTKSGVYEYYLKTV